MGRLASIRPLTWKRVGPLPTLPISSHGSRLGEPRVELDTAKLRNSIGDGKRKVARAANTPRAARPHPKSPIHARATGVFMGVTTVGPGA